MSSLINNRYKVIRELGKGGMGAVTLVEDVLYPQHNLALKTIHGDLLTQRNLAQFKYEFTAMAQVRHPNLVEVYDFGILADTQDYFFTMEYVPGEDWAAAAARHRQAGDDESWLYAVVAQVCRALQHIHNHGFVHYDVKPRNVRITAEGQVKLMDFGLIGQPHGKGQLLVRGTPEYVAPELIRRDAVDHRADLYSLGVSLYEIAVGELPFKDESSTTVLRQHVEKTMPVSPMDHPALSPVLRTLIVKLIAKDPDQRYGSANQVIAALNTLTGSAFPLESHETRAHTAQRSKFVGRAFEVTLLLDRLKRVERGEGQLLLIEGGAGAGKTRLAREARLQAQIQHVIVCEGNCPERAQAPYSPWISIFKQLLASPLPMPTLATAGFALTQLMPDLQEDIQARLPSSSAAPEGDACGSEDKVSLLRTAVDVLLTFDQPLLLILEDLQNADAETLEFLTELSQQLTTSRVLTLGTYRAVSMDKAHPLSVLIHKAQPIRYAHGPVVDPSAPLPFCQLLRLAPFDAGATEAMVRSVLGPGEDGSIGEAGDGASLPEDLLPWLLSETGGNPGFIENLLYTLLEENLLHRDASGWHIDLTNIPAMPSSILETAQRRLARLDDASLRILQWAAVIGQDVDVPLLGKVSENSEEDLLAVLSVAVDRHVLVQIEQVDATLYRFSNEQMRLAIYNTLTQEDRAHHHRRCAETLMEQNAEEAAELLTWHFAQAGEWEQALRYAQIAANKACQVYAHRSAVRCYDQALEFAQCLGDAVEPLTCYDLLAGRAEANSRLAQHQAQESDLSAMADIARSLDDIPRQIEVMNRQVALKCMVGEFTKALHLGDQTLTLARKIGDPRLIVDSLDALGEVYFRMGETEKAYAYHKQALPLCREMGDLSREAHILWRLGAWARVLEGPTVANGYMTASLELQRALGNHGGVADALNELALLSPDYAQQRDYHEQSLEIAQHIGDRTRQVRSFNNLGLTYWYLGLYPRARAYLEQAVQMARETTSRSRMLPLLESMGRVYLALEDYESAQRTFEEGLALAQELGEFYGRSFHQLGLGQVFWQNGELEAARDLFVEAHAIQQERKMLAALFTTQAWWGAISLALGDWPKAMQHTQEALQTLEIVRNGEFPPQEVWWYRYQVLRAAPDPAKYANEAWEALQQAYKAMMEGIATLSDEGLRRNYLNKVKINRDIITEWTRQIAERRREQGLDDGRLNVEVERDAVAEAAQLQERLKRVFDISVRMNETHDAEFLLTYVMDQVIELSGAERGVLILFTANRQMDYRVAVGVDLQELPRGKAEISYSVLETVTQTRQPVLMQDTLTDERFGMQDAVLELNLRSLLCVPLIAHADLIGLIYSDNRSVSGRFSHADLNLMMIFANQAATAIENARLYGDLLRANDALAGWSHTLEERVAQRTAEVESANNALSRRAVQLETIAQVGRQVTSILDLDVLLERVVGLIQTQFDYYFVGVWLMDEAQGVLRLYAGTNNMAQRLHQVNFFIPLDAQSINASAYRSGEVRLVQNVSEVSDFMHLSDLPDLASEIVLPLQVGDIRFGTLNIGSNRSEQFVAEDEVVLGGLADQIAIAIRNAQLYALEQKRLRSTESLEKSGRELTSSLDMSEVPNRILVLLNALVPYERGMLLIRQGDVLVPVAHHGLLDSRHAGALHISISEGDVYRQLETLRRPLIIGDVSQEPGWSQIPQLPLNRSWLGVLLVAKGCAIGMVSLTRREANAFSEDDAMWVQAFAAQASIALENARYHAEIVRLNEQLEQIVRQRTEELRKANTILARIDKTKSDFIDIAAHELRTPLTVIIGFSQMLHRNLPVEIGSRVENYLDGITTGANRMKLIINSMLDVARIDSQTLQMSHQDVSLFDIVHRIQTNLSDAIRRRKLEFTIAGLADLPEIQGDSELLQKVFFHLITNAIKYTPDGGKITVAGKLMTLDDQIPGVEVTIRDTGVGINLEDQELIFEKFYQTGKIDFHSSGQTEFKAGGPGLGLAIARGVILAHAGKIWAESPGNDEQQFPGSTFHVQLPLESRSFS